MRTAFNDFDRATDGFQVIGFFGADYRHTRPDIATDGTRYVVVWRTTSTAGSYDIVGASIDRAGNVIPLSIAVSAADERDPAVVAIGNGTFLVAYEKVSDGQRSLAGRFVRFENRARGAVA